MLKDLFVLIVPLEPSFKTFLLANNITTESFNLTNSDCIALNLQCSEQSAKFGVDCNKRAKGSSCILCKSF